MSEVALINRFFSGDQGEDRYRSYDDEADNGSDGYQREPLLSPRQITLPQFIVWNCKNNGE